MCISAALLLFREWRTRAFASTLILAIVCALPWLTIWPWLLFQRSPQLFVDWMWTHNIGRWFGFVKGGNYREVFYYVKILPWLAWPALPLAAWAVWEARKKVWHQAEFQLLLVSFLVMLVTLSIVPDIKEVFALPMLLPIALLATASLSTLRRGAANALDSFGIMTLPCSPSPCGGAGRILDNNAWITHQLKNFQPGYEPDFHPIAFGIAFLATLAWVVLYGASAAPCAARSSTGPPASP